MRTLGIAVAIIAGLVIAGVAGYQFAAHQYSRQMDQQTKELKKDISLLLSLMADIADHRSRGEDELADWKFEAGHGELDSHVRAGGRRPSQFVLDIVEVDQLPPEDEEEDWDEDDWEEDDAVDEGEEEVVPNS